MSALLTWGDYLTKGAPPSKRFLIGGNWKCNGTLASAKAIIEVLNKSGSIPPESEVVIAVPSIHISLAKSLFRSEISVAAQDVGVNKEGAHTGEVSAGMLVDAGVRWVLTGHSERRIGFGGPGTSGESSILVAKKTTVALAAGMSVIFCIGESLAERESNRTLEVCVEQLTPIVAALSNKPLDWKRVVIAYEPVWAIGTGKVATPEQAEDTHREIRQWLAAQSSIGKDASRIRILYGGSVKGSNCKELVACPNVDGFLVGGASLLPEFVDIINSPISLRR
jgi:triosephosphate isomerase